MRHFFSQQFPSGNVGRFGDTVHITQTEEKETLRFGFMETYGRRAVAETGYSKE